MVVRGTLFAGGLIGLLLLGRSSSSGVAGVGGIAYAMLLGSLLEWAVHRYLYHGQTAWLAVLRRAHFFHHEAFVKDAYIVPASQRAYRRHRTARLNLDAARVRVGQVLVHWTVIAVAITLPSWMLTHSLVFSGCATVTGIALSALNFYLHETMHRHPARWITRSRLFAHLDAHHRGHHANARKNFNLALPLADFLFGTVAEVRKQVS